MPPHKNTHISREGRDPVRRKTKIRIIFSHTFQIGGRILKGDVYIFVGASEISGCAFFLSFLF